MPANESLDSSVIESKVEHESPTKKARISREEAIEELLNGLIVKPVLFDYYLVDYQYRALP